MLGKLMRFLFRVESEPVMKPKGAIAAALMAILAVLFGANMNKLGIGEEHFFLATASFTVLGVTAVVYFNRQ